MVYFFLCGVVVFAQQLVPCILALLSRFHRVIFFSDSTQLSFNLSTIVMPRGITAYLIR